MKLDLINERIKLKSKLGKLQDDYFGDNDSEYERLLEIKLIKDKINKLNIEIINYKEI